MILVGVVVAGLVAIGTAGPAGAKGAKSLTITGPGLARPIEIAVADPEPGQDRTPSFLVVALAALTDPTHERVGDLATARPSGIDLRTGYTLTWQMFGPSGANPADYRVVQDVYPDADGGPVVHTRPSHWLRSQGGWTDADPALRDTLAALGVPVRGLPTGLSTPTPAVAPRPPARPADRSSGSSSPWPLAAAAAFAGGLALGLAAPRLRRLRVARAA
jgi:hypothetical protein